MTTWIKTIAIAACALAVTFAVAPRADAASGTVVYSIESDFETVALDVADAIINRGYVVDYTGRIGEMLKRTASDVGATKSIYENAQMAQFCSAVLSRQAMEADPQNIAFCPYTIFFYELTDEPGIVHVGYRVLDGATTPESEEALETVNTLLEEIVREVTAQ